jgi:hypothetical protein
MMALVDWARCVRGGLEFRDEMLESLEVTTSGSVEVLGVGVVSGAGSSVGCRVLSRTKGIASVFVLALSSSWEGGVPFIVDAMVFALASSWHEEITAKRPRFAALGFQSSEMDRIGSSRVQHRHLSALLWNKYGLYL